MTMWDHCCGPPALPPVGWLFQLILLTQSPCYLLHVLDWTTHFLYVRTTLEWFSLPACLLFGWKRYTELGSLIQNCLLCSEPLLLLLGSLKQAGGRTQCILLFAQLYLAGYDIDLLGMDQLGKSGPGVGFCSFREHFSSRAVLINCQLQTGPSPII